jgi:hypothetical protein
LFGLKGGEFRLAPFTQPSRHTIDGQWEGLLMEAAQASDEQAGELAAENLETKSDTVLTGRTERHIEEVVLSSTANDILYQWQSTHADRRVVLLDWLLVKSATVVKLLPGLGHADRLEIREPGRRVICLLQPERKMFVRLSMNPAQD